MISVSQKPRTRFGTHKESTNKILLNQLISLLFGDGIMVYIFLKQTYFADVQWSMWITIVTRKKKVVTNWLAWPYRHKHALSEKPQRWQRS